MNYVKILISRFLVFRLIKMMIFRKGDEKYNDNKDNIRMMRMIITFRKR